MPETLPLDVIWDIASNMSFTAAINQRYHQALASSNEGWEAFVQGGVGLLAVLSLSATIVAAYRGWHPIFGTKRARWKAWNTVSMALGASAAVFAIWLNVISYAETARFHREMLLRWSELRRDSDRLVARVTTTSEDAADLAALSEQAIYLQARKNDINALEGAPDDELLERCHELEEKARGWPAAQVAAR